MQWEPNMLVFIEIIGLKDKKRGVMIDRTRAGETAPTYPGQGA